MSRFPLSRRLWLLLIPLLAAVGWGVVEFAPEVIPVDPIELNPVMVKQIQISGALRHVEPKQVRELVDQYGVDGILALDPEQLRMALEALPWIYQARVRKVWPDQLALTIEEQRATVLWGDQGYLNLDGVYFDAAGVTLPDQQLPLITSHQRDTVAVYQLFSRLSRILQQQSAEPVAQSATEPATEPSIRQMAVDQRGAVTLHLRDGLAIQLGRRAMEQRLQRWVDQAPKVVEQFKGQLQGVDLRYERGMVLQQQEKGASARGKQKKG